MRSFLSYRFTAHVSIHGTRVNVLLSKVQKRRKAFNAPIFMKFGQILTSIMCTSVTNSNRRSAVESTDTQIHLRHSKLWLSPRRFSRSPNNPTKFLYTSHVSILFFKSNEKCRKWGKISFTTPRVRSKINRADFHEARRSSTALSAISNTEFHRNRSQEHVQ